MIKISAIMPVYNGEEFVDETIESILNQSYSNFEFIIVNDGSTDKTREIIEGYQDERIKLYNLKENRGVGYASNFAVEKAKGEYIARIDSDDIYHKDKFLLQKEYLDKNEDISLVKTYYDYFANDRIRETARYKSLKNTAKERNESVTPQEISDRLYWDMCIPNNTIMIRANVMRKFGYEDMLIGEDYYLFYHMNKQGYKMGTVAKELVKTRVRDDSITAKKRAEGYESKLYIKKDIIVPLFLNDNVYIWGAGSCGEQVQKTLKKHSFYIKGFIDSDYNKQGMNIDGIIIDNPAILLQTKSPKIIVASQPGKASIVKELESMGFNQFEDYIVY